MNKVLEWELVKEYERFNLWKTINLEDNYNESFSKNIDPNEMRYYRSKSHPYTLYSLKLNEKPEKIQEDNEDYSDDLYDKKDKETIDEQNTYRNIRIEELRSNLKSLENQEFILQMKDHWNHNDWDEKYRIDREVDEIKKELKELGVY